MNRIFVKPDTPPMPNHTEIGAHILAHLPISNFRFLELLKLAEINYSMARRAEEPRYRPRILDMGRPPRHLPAIPEGIDAGIDALECITDPIALESPRGALLWLIRGQIPYEVRVEQAMRFLTTCFVNSQGEEDEICKAALSKLREGRAHPLPPRFAADLVDLLLHLWRPGRKDEDPMVALLTNLRRHLERLDAPAKARACSPVLPMMRSRIRFLERHGRQDKAAALAEALQWFEANRGR